MVCIFGVKMTYNLIAAIVAFVLMIADLISMIFRLRAGKNNQKPEHDRRFWVKEIAIFVCAPLLLVLCIFINLGLIGTIAICGCAVLAVEVAVQELVGKKKDDEKPSNN